MYFTQIEGFNFQKHEYFKIDFSDKVNAIFGETDAGKSCIVRAIKWVVHGEPKGDVVRKDGTEKTSVKITLDSGVAVERRKSDSVNAYVIYKDGEERKFDSIGKTIPDEVKNIFNMHPLQIDKEQILLNVADQLSPPFMLKNTPTFRMKVLNKLTGNDILDSVAQSFNKDSLRLGREVKIIEEELVVKEDSLKGFKDEKDGIEELLSRVNPLVKSLSEKSENHQMVLNLKLSFDNLNSEMAIRQDKIELIKYPADSAISWLKNMASRFEKASHCQESLISISENITYGIKRLSLIEIPDGVEVLASRLDYYIKVYGLYSSLNNVNELNKSVVDKLKSFNIPEKEAKGLHKRAETFLKVSGLSSAERSKSILCSDIGLKIKSIIADIGKETRNYKVMLKEYKKCPVCHSEITDEVLRSIQL